MVNIEKIKPEIADFAKTYRLRFVVLFGSRAKCFGAGIMGRRPRKTSDFDIAVALEGHHDIFSSPGFYGALLDFFSTCLRAEDHKIDLSDLNRADILLRYEVTSGGILLYGDEDDYAQFRAFAFKDYVDASPLFALEEHLVQKRQNLLKEVIGS